MAQLDIDIKVNGEEQLKSLDNTIKEVSKDTNDLSENIKKSETDWVAFGAKLGAITTVLSSVGAVMKNIANAGVEWSLGSEKVQANLKAEETAWTHLKASISDNLGLTEAKIKHDEAVLLGMQRITSWITDKSIPAIQAEQKALEDRTKAMADWRTMFEDSLDSYIKKVGEQIDRDEWILEVKQRYAEAQKQREADYEKELEDMDKWIDKKNKETDEQIKNNQARQDGIPVVDNYTDSVEQSTKALEDNTGAYQSSALTTGYSSSTFTGAGSSAGLYGTAFQAQGAIDYNQQMVDYLRTIAQTNTDTNDAVRGY